MAIKTFASFPTPDDLITVVEDTDNQDEAEAILTGILDLYIQLVPNPTPKQLGYLGKALCLNGPQSDVFAEQANAIFASVTDRTGMVYAADGHMEPADESLLPDNPDADIEEPTFDVEGEDGDGDFDEDDFDEDESFGFDAPVAEDPTAVGDDFSLTENDLDELRVEAAVLHDLPVKATPEMDFVDVTLKNDGVEDQGPYAVDQALKNDGEPELLSLSADPSINDGEPTTH